MIGWRGARTAAELYTFSQQHIEVRLKQSRGQRGDQGISPLFRGQTACRANLTAELQGVAREAQSPEASVVQFSLCRCSACGGLGPTPHVLCAWVKCADPAQEPYARSPFNPYLLFGSLYVEGKALFYMLTEKQMVRTKAKNVGLSSLAQVILVNVTSPHVPTFLFVWQALNRSTAAGQPLLFVLVLFSPYLRILWFCMPMKLVLWRGNQALYTKAR